MSKRKVSRNAILFATIKVALLLIVVVAGIGLITVFWVIPHQVRTPEVAVPNLVGQDLQRAVEVLNSVGLKLDPDIDQKSSAEIPKGYIIEQEPPADFKIKLNKPVRLTLSTGSEAIVIPDVAGKHLNDADEILKGAGFRRGRVAAVHSDRYAEVNTVIAQTPPAGRRHQRGGAIHLLLSLGVRPKVFRMPDLHRMPIDEVRFLLESHGLKIGQETYKPHPEINQGLIIDHEPVAGKLIPIGQVVNLNISGSRRSQTDNMCTIPVKYRVSSTGAPSKRVRIVVEDARGTRIEVVNGPYQSGMLIDKPPVRVTGNATMSIYEDDKLVKTEEFDW